MKRNVLNTLAALACAGAMAATFSSSALAQSSNEGLRVGIIAGANYNYVDAPTQKFVQTPANGNFTSRDFSGTSGFEVYTGLVGEYLFNDMLGVTLRASYDARCTEKEDNGATFTPRMLYVSIEPGLRVNLGMPELYVMAGGTVAITADAKYDYTPASGEPVQKVTDGELKNVEDVAFGGWLGFGYDIRMNDKRDNIGWYITPFVEGSYLFDQKDPDVAMDEDKLWNTLTGRAGVQVKVQF